MDADILPPSDDRVFKLILTSPDAKPVLADLISALISRPVVDVIVCNNELPVENTQEKSERFDINCKTNDGSQIDLEMQASRIREDTDGEHRNLKGKSIYYLCDLHSSQPSKGWVRYDKLAMTYQITFCSYTVFTDREGYVNTFSLRHNEDGGLLSDAINVVYVELSKLDRIVKKPVNEMTDLEKWAIFFQYADMPKYREKLNKVIETKEALQMAGELLLSVSQDERERAVARSRRMFQTDLASNLRTAEDIGIAKGKLEKSLEIARNMIRRNKPIEDIIEDTGLTREEVGELLNKFTC
jgi:predicted transposase/invertase (TIGR01784 family)